jgi:peptidoglycan/LPS O-acetylase OafA/YrhL
MMEAPKYYKPELDILRLCAFLFVFFTHRMDLAPIDPKIYYWGHHISLVGVFGVPLFFFLSAFLITELLIKEKAQYGQISIRSFYIRRILRIWPLYFAFFFGMVLISQFTDLFGHISGNTQLAFSLFAGNWHITFNGWLRAYPINPLWSISVEEQLYIILPLVIYYTSAKGLKIFSWLALLAAYAAIFYYAQRPTEKFSGEWTNSFVQFQFFSAGILISVYLKGWQPQWGAFTRIILFVSGLACWLIASIVCEVHADAPHTSTILQAITGWLLILTGVVLFFFALYGASVKHFPNFLLYLGKISFGMYIFHITFFWIIYRIFKVELLEFSDMIGLKEWSNDVGFVIAFIATVLTANLSYNYFEKPFLKLKKKFTLVQSRD